MSPAERFHDATAIGIGWWIGTAGAKSDGGLLFVAIIVAVIFIVARAIEDHYIKQIHRKGGTHDHH